jgi:hypothetical protein
MKLLKNTTALPYVQEFTDAGFRLRKIKRTRSASLIKPTVVKSPKDIVNKLKKGKRRFPLPLPSTVI